MRMNIQELSSEQVAKLMNTCTAFRDEVTEYARSTACIEVEELMAGFNGFYQIGDDRSDYVKIVDQTSTKKWYETVQDDYLFDTTECHALEAYINADWYEDDIDMLRHEAESTILEHMRGIIRGYEDNAGDFAEDVLDLLQDEFDGFVTDDFTHIYQEIPAHYVSAQIIEVR